MNKAAFSLLTLLLAPLCAGAQSVFLGTGEEAMAIPAEQTQTETKPGWKIVDIKLKDKHTRYLWGAHAKAIADSSRPTFQIFPAEGETLTDYALVALKARKQYRRLRKPALRDNDCLRFLPEHFDICPAAALGFACTPREPLPAGEYIIVCLSRQPANEEGDFVVHAFSVLKALK